MFSKAQGLGDLLNLADYVEKIITYEKNMLDDFKMVRQYVELCKEELEWDKALLDDTKAAVETEQKNLEDLI
jgi:peptidoglycan hydrolase CwlO-like protein